MTVPFLGRSEVFRLRSGTPADAVPLAFPPPFRGGGTAGTVRNASERGTASKSARNGGWRVDRHGELQAGAMSDELSAWATRVGPKLAHAVLTVMHERLRMKRQIADARVGKDFDRAVDLTRMRDDLARMVASWLEGRR